MVDKNTSPLDSGELAIMGYMARRSKDVCKSATGVTGISGAKNARIIQSLRNKGMLVRGGSRQAGSWRIVQGGAHG